MMVALVLYAYAREILEEAHAIHAAEDPVYGGRLWRHAAPQLG
jgi:hypothetical protein